ncbi:MAG: response regulator, partial [Chloroflexaceae bacterium]|nr:response regulator [Chloroflexaceae bacterium]
MTDPGNLLVVDDMPDNLRLLSALLAQRGYKVRKALNGKIALATAQRVPPDLILLDINMPGANGYEVCQQLKAHPKTQEIPVIFISALDDVFDKVKAFQVGGVDYIAKPFHEEEAIARIEHQLTIRRQQQELQEKNEQLQQEIKERCKAEDALRVYLHAVSHDLRNPVIAMSMVLKG